MSNITIREMLEAGAHFGHQTHRWNPKMKKYIFGSRNGIHIIDLQKTVGLYKQAYDFIHKITAKGGKILFIGTKKQAQEIIAEEVERPGQYYVNNRWLGGMLTNFQTIKKSVERLCKIEEMSKDGTFEKLPKKEVVFLNRELAKLEKNLKGIRNMDKLPKAVFVLDPKQENIAILEARKLEIPVVATLDTNCDPDLVDYPIPANDDSLRSIRLFISKIADACAEGAAIHQQELAKIEKEQPAQAPVKSHTSGKNQPQVDVIAPLKLKELEAEMTDSGVNESTLKEDDNKEEDLPVAKNS